LIYKCIFIWTIKRKLHREKEEVFYRIACKSNNAADLELTICTTFEMHSSGTRKRHVTERSANVCARAIGYFARVAIRRNAMRATNAKATQYRLYETPAALLLFRKHQPLPSSITAINCSRISLCRA